MKLASRDAPIARYAATLKAELRLLADHLPGRMRISHLHWGGGTPTALSPGDLTDLMQTVGDLFTIDPDAERAIESDPRTLSAEMIRTIGALGFTRASFGVQEFDPHVQRAINRVQPPDMVARAVDGLREAGVGGINFDLIYGLPHQTTKMLCETITISAGMRPDRVALFGYAHVPWMAKKQRLIDTKALPDAAARLDQATHASRALEDAGYQAIGLDHFARPDDPLAQAARNGQLRRNFQGYTTDGARTMLGVGATSIGRLPDRYVQNLSETGAWARAVAAGQLPVGRGAVLCPDDLLRADVIEALMCRGRADLRQIASHHGTTPAALADADAELRQMARDGLLTRTGDTLTLTRDGAPFVRVVAAAFDRYLQAAASRHAVAV